MLNNNKLYKKMKKQLEAVHLFHETYKVPQNDSPTLVSEKIYNLRHNLMKEENEEYIEACQKGDLVEIADALGDKLYILCGTILAHGLQHKIEEVFNEIQSSNMSKLGEDGQPIFREDGKILKGPNYFRPDIEKILK
ncbi:MAG: nucleoside triphosphate pyrophosphohydrolase family protein [Flavisolibacter sp.]